MTTPKEAGASHFLLVGNGPYRNRGCEAIVRGTMEILRHEFGPQVRAQAGVVGSPDMVQAQAAAEIDPAVNAFALSEPGGPRWSREWFTERLNQHFGTTFHPHLKDLENQIQFASLALEVGGDHYSLDYGKPLFFMAMDRFLRSRGLPVVLWGASVGPFDEDPKFAPRMFDHLRSLSAIFVRESDSFNYLRAHGVSENVHLMADPAFVMKPVEPPAAKIGFALPAGAIGINLSQMLAFCRGQRPGDVDLKEWLGFCIGLVKSAATLKRPILLIPHVGSVEADNQDFGLLHSVCQAVANDVPVPVQVLPDGLNAAELKWIIARCAVFAGARTHSTIAALSSHVPTLSIAYSLKAKGINRDVYGHLDHCVHVSKLTHENFAESLRVLIANETDIRTQLQSHIPELQGRAFGAGAILRKFLPAAVTGTRAYS